MKLNYEVEVTQGDLCFGSGEVHLRKGLLRLGFLGLGCFDRFVPDSINDKVFSSIDEGLQRGLTDGECEGFKWVLKHSE